MNSQDLFLAISEGELFPIVGKNDKPDREYILFNKDRNVCTLIREKRSGKITLWEGSKTIPEQQLPEFWESCRKEINTV